MTAANQGRTTVGVALPIPEPWGGELQRLRTGYGEAHAVHIPTHITLLPPTPVSRAELSGLTEHLHRVATAHAPFQVVLRGTGTFRPISQVVFIQVALGVASCEQLERAVRSGPVVRELEFPYHPHVTVAHGMEPEVLDRAFTELAGFDATFTADRFVAYAHNGDEVWHEIGSCLLQG